VDTLNDQAGRPHGDQPVCDPARPNGEGRPAHDYEFIDEEYGSLRDGGSYEHYRCRRCGRHAYSPLPD